MPMSRARAKCWAWERSKERHRQHYAHWCLWSSGWLWVPRACRRFGLHERCWCRKSPSALGRTQVSLCPPGLSDANHSPPRDCRRSRNECCCRSRPLCPVPVHRRSWSVMGTLQDTDVLSERSVERWGDTACGAGMLAFHWCG